MVYLYLVLGLTRPNTDWPKLNPIQQILHGRAELPWPKLKLELDPIQAGIRWASSKLNFNKSLSQDQLDSFVGLGRVVPKNRWAEVGLVWAAGSTQLATQGMRY